MAAHIETGTMASSEHYSSKLLKHLGLVAGMYDELGLGELVDRLIVQDGEKRRVSVGQAITYHPHSGGFEVAPPGGQRTML